MEECDCKAGSPCTATYPCGDGPHLEDSATDLWASFNSVSTAALSVLGYLLYRFSQGLPAVIRWPIRVICSLTGLTSLWSWVSRLLQTLLRFQALLKWLSTLWRIIIGTITTVRKCVAAVTKPLASLSGLVKDNFHQRGQFQCSAQVIGNPQDYGLRVILVGPEGDGQTLALDALLGCGSSQSGQRTLGVSTGSVSWRAVVGGRQVTVVNAPDLLGSSLGVRERAWEALRSLQLVSPGPHAFLLLMQFPVPGGRVDADAIRTLRTLLNLVGEGALSYVLPVLIHTGSVKGPVITNQLLEGLPRELEGMLSMCSHRPVVLSCGPRAKRRALGSELLKRVEEMSMLGRYYRHELHREEDSFREKLLEDMAAALELKLEEKEEEELSVTRWQDSAGAGVGLLHGY